MAGGEAVKIGIGGDPGGLVSAIDQSEQIIQRFADQTRATMQRFAQNFAGAFDWNAQVAKGGNVLRAVVKDLDLLVKGMAGQVKVATKSLVDFADQLSRVTEFSNEAAVAVEKVFLAMGTLDEAGIKRATVAAADMAAETGKSFQESADLIASALRDPLAAMDQLRAAGVAFTDAEIKMFKAMAAANDQAGIQNAILTKIEAAMGQAANKGPLTMAKALASLKNAWNDVVEVVTDKDGPWEVFASVIQKAADTIRGVLIPALRVTLDVIMSFKQAIKEVFMQGLDAALEGAIVAFSALQAVVVNWQTSMHAAFLAVEVVAVKAFTVIQHWLTNVIPQYLEWFSKSWKTIFENISDATISIMGTIVDNITGAVEAMAKKIGSIISRQAKLMKADLLDSMSLSSNSLFAQRAAELRKEVADADASGGGSGFKPKGFNLPPGRPLGALPSPNMMPEETKRQQMLMHDLRESIEAMGADFDEFLAQNRELVAQMKKGNEDEQKKKAQQAINDARGKGAGGKAADATKAMQASLESLTGLNDRITAAAGSGSNNPVVNAVNKAGQQQAAAVAAAAAQQIAARQKLADKAKADADARQKRLEAVIKAGGGLR